MTPLPSPLGAPEVIAWRLDEARFAPGWDSGEGGYLFGGRWNSKGVRAVYCALDPSTAILEVAVHKGFRTLDTVPHVLTALRIKDPMSIRIVQPGDVPNPNWMRPGVPSAGQQTFGDGLLSAHAFMAIPSAVSVHSWNLVFVATVASGGYDVVLQEPFALDTRLHPPT